MNWIETEQRAVVNVVMNIRFQICGKFLVYLRTCINTTVQTVRWQNAVPCRTDSSVFLLPDMQLCSSSQHSALQSALFLQSTFLSPVPSVPPVNIPLSSPLCSSSQHSPLQSSLLRHIKPIILSVPHFCKHRPSTLHQSRTVTSPDFHCEGLWSTPSRFMYEQWCSSSSTNFLRRTDLDFTLHSLCLCVSAVSSF